jgi:hypothetical protein
MKLKPITVIAVLVLVVASLLVAGCTQTTTTTQSSNGSATETGGITATAKAVTMPTLQHTVTPTPGNKYIAYNCTVKNINAQNRPIAPNYWSLMDTGGRVYNISGLTIVQSLNPFGGTSHSQPGDVISGPVFFEVPQNATLKSLTYNDGSTNIVTTI